MTTVFAVHPYDGAQSGGRGRGGGFSEAECQGRDDNLVYEPPGLALCHHDDVQVAQAAGTRELRLHVWAGHRAQAVVRHAH